jgi:hypothetical protein
MRNATWDQRTVLQALAEAGADRYAPLVTLEGVSLLLDSSTRLLIDGEGWYVLGQRAVAIDTQARTVVTTVTVVRDS